MNDAHQAVNLCPGDEPPSGLPIVLVSAVALVDADGRVLVAQRPEGKHLAGLWEFPGGKVEPGEPPELALVRELKEELGIDTAASCLAPCGFVSHAYEKFHLVMLIFACRKWNGRPVGQQGQPLRWVRVPDLFKLDMPPADRPVLGLLQALL
ncbi:(deoxy)nucleoside triphosphate pyrophosphohydrolase [Sphingoaurantiacus capsulatus]|uniref:8-oxo-dGTP diphosphatase n=1 Tax=Sphingoaurantiacus capsulatus TaxID=1771310 RepID=A0ABV7X7U1_9SPHN